MKLNEICSPFLQAYISQQFGVVNVTETKATCQDCLCSKAQRGKSLPFYQAELKCCTFHPFLPNYAVGYLLESAETPSSIKNVLRQKIRNREYALPMGIFVPVKYQVAFNNRSPEDFGNRAEFLCPYYDRQQQQCGVWLHRGSVCTSYYCTSDRGEAGLQFWSTLGDYLHICEMVLAQDCVVSMGLPPEIIESQLEYINCETGTAEELASNGMSETLFKTHWSDWSESVEEFYLSCNRYLSGLDIEQLHELLDAETFEFSEFLKAQIATMGPVE